MGHDRRIKTEATGKSRWCPRAVAKEDANVKRRHIDKRECGQITWGPEELAAIDDRGLVEYGEKLHREEQCTQTTETDASGSSESSSE